MPNIHEYVLIYEALRAGRRAVQREPGEELSRSFGLSLIESSPESIASSAGDELTPGLAVRAWLGIPLVESDTNALLLQPQHRDKACEAMGGLRLHNEQRLALASMRSTAAFLDCVAGSGKTTMLTVIAMAFVMSTDEDLSLCVYAAPSAEMVDHFTNRLL